MSAGLHIYGARDNGARAVGVDVAERARAWAIANGDNPRIRIVLAGLEGEHPMPSSWREVVWTGPAGLGRRSGNRHKERLWLSPHCLADRGPLFERAAS
jgi:hypothetical protein